MAKALLALFTATGLARQVILVGAFGFKSDCKHAVSCSTYAKEQITQRGLIRGGVSGLLRVATCW